MTSVNDMNGEAVKHLLGDEDESVNDLKDPEVDPETQVEATEVTLPSENFTMEDNEAEHLALAGYLTHGFPVVCRHLSIMDIRSQYCQRNIS